MNKDKTYYIPPSVSDDIVGTLLYTFIVLLVLFIIDYLFGKSEPIDTNTTAFLGILIAFSGLMIKQYLYKETIQYLIKWEKLKGVLDKIIQALNTPNSDIKEILVKMKKQREQAGLYTNYLRKELKIIPIIPVILLFLYGASLLSCDNLFFRYLCLIIMFCSVIYLTRATITSNNIILEISELDEVIILYENILIDIESPKTA
ncbi:MAG: hypothetical protein JRF60_17085 [Deltaproteobacteria bacterium]|nr:hypothetical protein [Deltaproteobacteria bacterium]MBW2562557.1 hypothetical protein [Deltaproteobacteria bacterium]